MKLCVLGVGAVGGILAAHLARLDDQVSLIEQGARAQAIRARGLRLIGPGDHAIHVRPPCTDDPASLGPQDFVFVCVKAYSVPAAAAALAPLLGRASRVVFIQNGIPWWYFHALDGPWRDHGLDSIDPGGRIRAALDPGRAIGCVTYVAADVIEPGVVRSTGGFGYDVGEPDGRGSEDCRRLVEVLERAGIEARASPRIRDDIWLKLWGNLALNPVSVLTGATFDAMCGDPETRALIKAMMAEAQAVAERLGARFATDMDTRLAAAASLRGFKSSMLQDLEGGRPLEIDAIVGAVADMGRLVGVATPMIDTVLGLVRQRAETAGRAP